MKNSKKHTLITALISFIVVIIAAGCFIIYEYYYKDIWKYAALREERHKKIECSYNENPNLNDAFDLLDYYMGKENYDKALLYGKACFDLGAKDETINGKINFFLARIYHQKHKEGLAREHLLVAIKMSGGRINDLYKIAVEYNLHHLLTDAEWEARKDYGRP
ncbi:MAG: hypothetical protein GY699_18930 [Desulfobacteraceae bacterium]|nr:hypothetical protein [Desulfobacteraceae bacterium]